MLTSKDQQVRSAKEIKTYHLNAKRSTTGATINVLGKTGFIFFI